MIIKQEDDNMRNSQIYVHWHFSNEGLVSTSYSNSSRDYTMDARFSVSSRATSDLASRLSMAEDTVS